MPMGKEVDFGLDNFQRPKMLERNESIAQSILNILLMRKGQLPSMPHVGIDIYSYMYRFEDDIDTDGIMLEVQSQCADLAGYINADAMQIAVIPVEGHDILMIVIPLPLGDTNVVYAFSKENDVLLFNYKFDDTILG